MSVVIHGFDGLFLEIFDGTRSVMITDIAFLKSFHMSFTDVYCVLMIFSIASCIWLPIMDLYVDDKKHFPEPDTQTRQKIGPDTNS
jgi:hypothetical protein